MGDFLTDLFGGSAGITSARRATQIPPQLQKMFQFISDTLSNQADPNKGWQPFVGTPGAPQLGETPQEDILSQILFGTRMGGESRPLSPGEGGMFGRSNEMIESAFGRAKGLSETPLDYESITKAVEPQTKPFIENLIQREGVNRRQLGEEINVTGAFTGSPLIQGQKGLQEQTNRDIAETIAGLVGRERQTRSGEVLGGLGEMGRLAPTGMSTLPAMLNFAGRGRDIKSEQFGLESSASQQRMQGLQQVFDILMGGTSAATQAYGIQSNAYMNQAKLQQLRQQAAMDFWAQNFHFSPKDIGSTAAGIL